MNIVVLHGRLGADPELVRTPKSSVLKLRIATSQRRKGADGEWSDHTEWHAVILWGARGEALAGKLAKGTSVTVRGALETSSWEAKDGSGKRYKTQINAEDIAFSGERSAEQTRPQQNRPLPGVTIAQSDDPFSDDDIPF